MDTFSDDRSLMLQNSWRGSVSIRELWSCFHCVLHWISTAYSELYLCNHCTRFLKWTEIQRFHCGSQTTPSHSMFHLTSVQESYSVLKQGQLDFPWIADRHKPLPSNMCVWLDWGCQGSIYLFIYLWWVVDIDTGPSEWTGTVKL